MLSGQQWRYQKVAEKTSLIVREFVGPLHYAPNLQAPLFCFEVAYYLHWHQIFFGCPHRAADPVEWERLAARLIFAHGRKYRSQISKILKTSREALARLSKEYESIAGIYETLNVYEAEKVEANDASVSAP